MKKGCDLEKFEILFKIVYLVHIVSCSTNLLYSTFFTKITTVAVVGMSTLLLFHRLMHIKLYLKTPYWYLYCFFLISMAATSVVNVRYGVFSNIKIIIWMLIQFFCLCFFGEERSKESVQKEIKIVVWTIVILSMIFNAISICMLFTFYSKFRYLTETNSLLIGYAYWGRLYGAYVDPNYASVFSVVALLSGFYLLISYKDELKKTQKWLLLIANVLAFMYITFSASRTAIVVLSLSLFSFFGQLVYIRKNNVWKAIMVGILVGAIAIGGEKLTITAFNGYSNMVSLLSTNETKVNNKIGRDEELSGDISNRRFSIWKDALAISMKNPVFGISFGNIDSYAEKEMPNAYIITNDFGVFDAFHNMFFDLAACQGIVGIISFGAIIISSLIFVNKRRKLLHGENMVLWAYLFSSCLTIFCSGFFLSLILYVHNLDTVLFWMLWGYFLWLNNSVSAELNG